jgi:hypothetical protein
MTSQGVIDQCLFKNQSLRTFKGVKRSSPMPLKGATRQVLNLMGKKGIKTRCQNEGA